MFDSLIESTSLDPRTRPRWAYPTSMAVHLLVLAAVVGMAQSAVEVARNPAVVVPFMGVAPPPPPPPPPPPAGGAESMVEETKTQEAVPVPATIVQVQEVPDVIETATPLVETTNSTVGVEDGFPGGVLGESGAPGGGPGGQDGGVPGGTPGSDGTGPLHPGMDGVTKPRLLHKVKPDYPESARIVRMTGKVILKAVILANGTVADVEVLSCRPPGFGFDTEAVEAVEKWRYEPALQGDKPVDVFMTVVVEFSLE